MSQSTTIHRFSSTCACEVCATDSCKICGNFVPLQFIDADGMCQDCVSRNEQSPPGEGANAEVEGYFL